MPQRQLHLAADLTCKHNSMRSCTCPVPTHRAIHVEATLLMSSCPHLTQQQITGFIQGQALRRLPINADDGVPSADACSVSWATRQGRHHLWQQAGQELNSASAKKATPTALAHNIGCLVFSHHQVTTLCVICRVCDLDTHTSDRACVM